MVCDSTSRKILIYDNIKKRGAVCFSVQVLTTA